MGDHLVFASSPSTLPLDRFVTGGRVVCGYCGRVIYPVDGVIKLGQCPCRNPEPAAVIVPPKPSEFCPGCGMYTYRCLCKGHRWSEQRGDARFCGWCGENYAFAIKFRVRECSGFVNFPRREANIEAWIRMDMWIRDTSRLPVVRGTEPAWSNITAALNAPPGWNRR